MPARTRYSALHRRLMTVLFTGLLLFTVGAVAAPAAQAAGCYQSSCNGKDASAQNCGGKTATSKQWLSPDAVIELRYSASCDANWARLVYSGEWNCCVQKVLREEQQRWNGSAWVAYRKKDKTFTWEHPGQHLDGDEPERDQRPAPDLHRGEHLHLLGQLTPSLRAESSRGTTQ